MSELIVRYDRELRRVDTAIVSIQARSRCDQMRVQSLLAALYAEREQLRAFSPRRRRS